MWGTRLTVRTLEIQARKLEAGEVLAAITLAGGDRILRPRFGNSVGALVGIGFHGRPCNATGRRPDEENCRRCSNSRLDRLLDSSACDSVLLRNLSLSKQSR